MRLPTVFKKTVADYANPKLLAAYFGPFLLVGGFFALAFANNEVENVGSHALHAQEAQLLSGFVPFSFFWGAGIPIIAIAAVLGANSLAKEAQSGTLRILLSKPVRRWEVLLGMYLATVVYSVLIAVASLFLVAVLLFVFAGVDAGALAAVFDLLPGAILYAVYVAVVVGAFSIALAVVTRSRLQTVVALLVLPALYFAFIPIRTFAGDSYTDYYLYWLDVNYHFGNVYVFFQNLTGTEFSPQTQASLATWTGVYDSSTAVVDPLTGGMPTTLELTGHVPQIASLLLFLVLAAAALGGAIYRFERMDIG